MTASCQTSSSWKSAEMGVFIPRTLTNPKNRISSSHGEPAVKPQPESHCVLSSCSVLLLQEHLPSFLALFRSSHKTLGVRPPLRTFYIKIDSHVPLTCPNFLWSTSLRFGVTRFFRLILHFSAFALESAVFKGVLVPFIQRMGLINQDMSPGCFHCFKVSFLLGLFSRQNWGKKELHMNHKCVCVYI